MISSTKEQDYTEYLYIENWLLMIIYPLGWLLMPKIFFDKFLGLPNFVSLTGGGSIIIFLIGWIAIAKWFLILKSRNKKNSSSDGNDNGGGPPIFPGERILLSIFLLIICAIVYKLLININTDQLILHNTIKEIIPESKNSITIFDRATLWSAVYGTIFGTLSYLKSG